MHRLNVIVGLAFRSFYFHSRQHYLAPCFIVIKSLAPRNGVQTITSAYPGSVDPEFEKAGCLNADGKNQRRNKIWGGDGIDTNRNQGKPSYAPLVPRFSFCLS